MPASEALARELRSELQKLQAEKRLPSVAAAVVRAGAIVWEDAVGYADVDAGVEATPETQYRIGSITKTFTAVAVMQLRDAGALELEDSLDRFVEAAPHRPTIRRLLSHVSGLQREPPGEVWETFRFASPEELVADLASAEQVLPTGSYWHYSNLAFALLGIVVERASGLQYERYLRERILEPLALKRTTMTPEAPAARGYLVRPYDDGVWPEEPVATASFAPAGELWSTVRELCRWAAFLADPDAAVLDPKTVEEMRSVQAISDHERWTSGYGLGLSLRRDGERILVGHGGAMPGFIASCFVSPKDKVGAAALTNSGVAQVEPLVLKLVARTVDEMPVEPEAWRIEEPVPAELESVLGRWWLEGHELVFRWKRGRLEARSLEAPDWMPPAVFEPAGDGVLRTVSGPERGELLRLVRDDEGIVTKMYWATYPLTREPRVFGRS